MLRRLFAIAIPLGFAALYACTTESEAADVCQKAQHLFQECGATLPMLTEGPCTASRRAIARCVTTHASDCEELATLPRRIDGFCASELDGGELEVPPGVLPAIPGRDAASPPASDAATEEPVVLDAGSPIVDAAVDAMIDAGTSFKGLGTSGTVLKNEDKRYTTPALPAGAYVVTLGGTGDADLYVRKSTGPTTTSFDCRPFLTGSSETCNLTVTEGTTLHLMVRGVATTSSFTISVLQEN